MQSKPLPIGSRTVALVALGLPLACSLSAPDPATSSDGSVPGSRDATATGGTSGGSGGTTAQPGDDRLFVPEGLSNTNLDGSDIGLALVAFTLVQDTTGPKLYAAVRNDGDTPACDAAMMTFFVDKADQVVTESGSVLQSGRLYRMTDGTILSCIAPGQVAMAASTDLPGSMMIDQLGYLKHRFPAFTVPGVVPIPGLSVSDVQTIATSPGNAYTGKVTNELDVAVSAPSIAIFPVGRAGRPLGAAMSSATSDIPPGGSWTFKTSAVDDLGVDYVAYPAASIPK
jgi:hypothetical protein